MEDLEKFLEKSDIDCLFSNPALRMKLKSKYLPKFKHYQKKKLESLVGLGVGYMAFVGGFIANRTEVLLVGVGIYCLFTYFAHNYGKKYKNLSVDLMSDIDTIQKGGIIDD